MTLHVPIQVAMICAALIAAAGCPDTGDQPLVTTTNQPALVVTPPAPPAELLAHVRLGPLPRVADDVAALGRRLGAWRVRSGELWPLVLELLGAATDLADVVDWRRPVHLLILDPARHRVPVAFLLPARQPDVALGRLSVRCRARRQGALWLFEGGGHGLLPCRFAARTLQGGLLVAPTPAALGRLWRFALITAHQDPGGGPALEARVFTGAGLAKLKFTAQKLDQFAKVGAFGLAMAGGDLDAAGRIEAQLTRLFAMLQSARDVGLTLSLGAEEVRLRLYATARPQGALARYIQGRGPAPLPALTALPRRAPVSISLAAPPAKLPAKLPAKFPAKLPAKAFPAEPGLLLSGLLTQVPIGLRKPLGRLVTRLLGERGGTRLALEPVDTGGFCLVGVVDHPQPSKLGAAVHQDLTQILAALRKQLSGRGFGDKALTTSRRRAQGLWLQDVRLGGTWPKGTAGLQLALSWIAGGDTLRLATASQGRRLVFALGAKAASQARATLARLKGSARVAQRGPVLPAGRLGRIRLSLVELVRAVPILGVGMKLPPGDTGALDLHWGVSPARRQVDATLHLPLSHLVASAPLWKWLLEKLEAQGKALSALAPPSGPEPDDAL